MAGVSARGRTLVLGDDINTDDIIPTRRCTTADPAHLSRYAFEHILGDGVLIAAYDEIEAGSNFGCGSSREHAAIAIKAAGIGKVRARSFGDIFRRNSINVGLVLELIGTPHQDPVAAEIIAAGGLFPFNHRRRTGALDVPASTTLPRPMTIAEKILARASGNQWVQPGETVFARVDLAMSHDAVAGPVARRFTDEFGADAKIWDPTKVVLVADHFIQINDIRRDPRATDLHRQMVSFAAEHGIRLFDEVAPGEAPGICHVLLPEEGLVGPGMVVAGTDSHTCTYGAFGAFATGVGTTDMANLLATGDIWVQVPPTIVVHLDGELPAACCAKDILLMLLGQIGCDGAAGAVLEFRGAVVERLPIEERMTLANMAVECGAVTGLLAPDERTFDYVGQRTSQTFAAATADAGASYWRELRFDLSDLEPQVARPPKPDQVSSVRSLGRVPITKAFVGSCTGGKLTDLAAAAAVLKDRHVAPGVAMFVVPASQRVRREAERLGYLEIFERAGASVLKSGCGACINAGPGALGAGEVGVYATSRNFTGRSGDASSQNYLASPRVVAISATQGFISDRFDGDR